MHAAFRTFVRRLLRSVVAEHHGTIALGAFLLTLASIVSIAFTWNIDSELVAMLPPNSEAARAMQEVDERVGAGGGLYVVIDSPSTEANKEFARDFAERLRRLDSVSLAHFHNDKTFFERHQLLYLPTAELEKLRERIDEEIEQAKKEANPLFVGLDSDDSSDDESGEPLSLESIEQKYDYVFERHKEYLVSEDGYALTIVVQFDQVASDMAATKSLLQRVRSVGHRLGPKSYHEKMTFELGGAMVSRKNTYQSILQDIQLSAVVTVGALFVVIALYFRRFRAVVLVLSPLVMGVLWTLAVSFLAFGALTTVSAFIFAILLGLGIDFSIHLLSSYDEHRAAGDAPLDALVRCYTGTGRATVIGAATTFTTFVVIAFTKFQGLSQFGTVASIGIALTLAAILVALPAFVLTFQSWWPHEATAPSSILSERLDVLFEPDRMDRWGPGVLIVLVGVTSLAVLQFDQLEFQEDFRDIGEIDWPWQWAETLSAEERHRDRAGKRGRKRAKHVEKRAVGIRKAVAPESFQPRREQTSTGEKIASATQGQRSTAPTMLLFDDASEAKRVSEYMRKEKESGELETVASVSSIYSFLPGEREAQKRRLEEIRAIDQLLDGEDLSVLEDDKRDLVERLRPKLDVEPVDIYDLPDWSKRIFRESGPSARKPHAGEEFAFEYILYLVAGIDQHDGGEARRLIEQLEDVRRATDADFRIASHAGILVSLIDEIQGEGLMLISVALLLIALLLMFVFGHPLRGAVTLVPLVVGSIWMLGLMGWLGIRFDFFNVAILPVVIGIGVDDGVHFFRHYRDEGPGYEAIRRTFRHVGIAILMTSVTSSIGFGGLVITDQQGLQSIGHLAITGIATTFLATVTVMPALLWLAERRDWSAVRADDG